MKNDVSDISERARALGVALSFFILLRLITSVLILAFAGAVYYLLSIVFKVLAFGLPVILYRKMTGRTPKRSRKRRKPSGRGAIEFLFAFSLTATLVNAVGILTEKTAKLFGADISQNSFSRDTGAFVFMFLGSVLFAAVTEELLFRGAVMDALEGTSARARIVISALLFAMMHCNFLQIPYAFAAGLVISAFYLRTRSLAKAVALHLASNALTYLFELLRAFGSAEAVEMASNTVFIALSAIAVCGVVYFVMRLGKEKRGVVCEKKSDIRGFFNVGTVTYLIITLLIAILNIF